MKKRTHLDISLLFVFRHAVRRRRHVHVTPQDFPLFCARRRVSNHRVVVFVLTRANELCCRSRSSASACTGSGNVCTGVKDSCLCTCKRAARFCLVAFRRRRLIQSSDVEQWRPIATMATRALSTRNAFNHRRMSLELFVLRLIPIVCRVQLFCRQQGSALLIRKKLPITNTSWLR